METLLKLLSVKSGGMYILHIKLFQANRRKSALGMRWYVKTLEEVVIQVGQGPLTDQRPSFKNLNHVVERPKSGSGSNLEVLNTILSGTIYVRTASQTRLKFFKFGLRVKFIRKDIYIFFQPLN